MFTMLFTIIFATLFITFASARPSFDFAQRDLSPCFLNCTNIALGVVGCNGIADLSCLCNSAVFRNVQTSCSHQMCPNEDSQLAAFQEQECAGYSTLSATDLISGAALTSNPVIPSPTTQASPTTSSPAPLYATTGTTTSNSGVVSSDTFAHLGNDNNNSSPDSSDHTGIIVGAVVGVVVLMVFIFFLYWWRRRVRAGSDHRLVRRSNRMSLAAGYGIGHSYQGDDGRVQPWSYPVPSASSSSGRAPRPFILSTTPLTKPQPSNHQNYNNHGYRELHSPADQDASEHSGTSASSPRRLTSSSGQRISMPPPAYQPSSISAKLGSWKQ